MPVLMTADSTDLLQLFARGERSLPTPALLELQTAAGISTISVTSVLRLLPRKRLVLRAQCSGSDVALKLFAVDAHGRKHIQRERAGLDAVRVAGLNAPSIVDECTAQHGAYVGLLYAWVDAAPPLAQLWPNFDREQKRQWLSRILDMLARLHAHGARQTDIHLGNFLLRDDALWLLDLGTIEIFSAALDRTQSLANLAAFGAQLAPADRPLLESLLPDYFSARGRGDSSDCADEYRRALAKFWRMRWRDYLDKSLRDCSLTQYQKDFSHVSALRRDAITDDLQQFSRDPDRLMRAGESLKAGNTATVVRTQFGGASVVIKRYNIKNWRHALSRLWRPTRAEHSWRFAHLLEIAGIRSPRPLALVEQRWGYLRGRAWFVCAAVVGENLLELGLRDKLPEPVVQSLRELLLALRAERISHGDFKATNFIVENEKIVLIDLDAMHKHFFTFGFERAFRRDLKRLQRNWADGSATRAQIDALINEILS